MKCTRKLAFIWVLVGFLAASPSQAADKIRLLIMSGSHPYETNQFLQLFKDNPDVTFESVVHPHAFAKLRPESAKNFDVLVLYDYAQKISPEAQADLVNFLKAGKGLLILHHAIAAYPDWPEYEKILGGRYYLQPRTVVNGAVKPRSRAREGAEILVHLADLAHPATRGLKDFEIHDETYFGYDVAPDSHLLLTTTNTNNAPSLAWSRSYEGARIIYCQLGHDHFAYENPNYRKFVAQAIKWVAVH
jgi:type 1 glutamine amidotransferase